MSRIVSLLLSSVLLPASLGSAQQLPIMPDDGSPLPRNLTAAEAAYLEKHPLAPNLRAVTPPPPGSVRCAAEYEPMDGIIIAWEGFNSLLAQMATHITTTGNADVLVACDSASEASSALSTLSAAGANMARVETMVVTTDTVWIRDYGPRYIYQGDVRSIVDHTYNRPRPNDNLFSTFFSGHIDHERYELALIHGGGNYHLNALGDSYATELISNENPTLTDPEIIAIWQDYQNVNTTITDALPSYVDSTQHIDMWMQIVADDRIIISDWPDQSGTVQDVLCDSYAASFAAAGWTVFRTPARDYGPHYTYTNMVMCNDLVLLPLYTNSAISPYNSQALAAVQAACPGKTVVQLNCESIIGSAGAMHCIVMHLPAHLGGVNPTAHLISPDGGESLDPGSVHSIEWLSDDDESVSTVDLLLSTDGGATWPTTIATGLAPNDTYAWTVPFLPSTQARVRVLAHDGVGNSGHDDSDADFTITNLPQAVHVAYGTGKPGTLGVPVLGSNQPPVIGDLITYDLSNGLPGGEAIYIFGVLPKSEPFDGGTILVRYFFYIGIPIDGTGKASLPVRVPPNPAFAGYSAYWQVWIPNDPGASGMGWASSNGLESRMGY
jgi:agmatine/peptidylarginine deiminase